MVFLQPSGGALVGCASNRKSFRHMASGFTYPKTSTNYLCGKPQVAISGIISPVEVVVCDE